MAWHVSQTINFTTEVFQQLYPALAEYDS